MRIDLHTHSNRSDGTDTPGELVERARQAALDVVALTDHDVADGWDEAQVAADRAGIQRLAAHGIQLTEAEVAVAQGDARVAGRPHIADAMVAAGYVHDRRQAFDEWLGEGRPGRVTKYNIPIFEAIALVAAAGGRSVVAHPWGRGSRRAMTPAFFAELADAGLDGIEVDHNDHLPDQRAQLRTIAHDLGLVATGSSDYHGAGKTEDFRLGANLTEPEELEKLLG